MSGMTREEAIKFLKSGCLMLGCEYHIKDKCGDSYSIRETKKDIALDMAIEDMKKQIPKKPILWQDKMHLCPNCHRDIKRTEALDVWCKYCGQALDWSKERG